MSSVGTIVGLICGFVWASPALAQVGEAVPLPPDVVARDAEGRVTVRAVRIAEPLTIDGQLDEDVYRDVPAIDGFVQQEPRRKRSRPARRPKPGSSSTTTTSTSRRATGTASPSAW